MAVTPKTLCLVVALLLFVVAALSAYLTPTTSKFNLVAAGLAFMALSFLVP